MWTAVTLWVGTLAGAALYVWIAVRAIAAGSPSTPWIFGIAAIYFGSVLFLWGVYFTLAWFFRARRPREVRIGLRATVRLLWREYKALAFAAPRMMFYRLLLRDPAPARIDVPVLLLHGVLCNAGVWTRMSRFLRRCGIDGVYTLSYGPPLASIEAFADQLADKIERISKVTGARSVMVVTHSMGGLVVRAYIRKHGIARLASVLTIGAPHHGSVHAWLLFGTSLAQLRPGNPWLAELNRMRLDPSLRFVSLWSWHDSMVAPQTSAELPGATSDVAVIGVGHNALLADAEVLERTQAEIMGARADARRHAA
jgi:triacylglycerol esterase/lipase EstA (alpha/beta hydrolase family)